MLRKCLRVLSGVGFAALGVGFAALLCGVAVLWAQSTLGTAQSFAVLGGSTVTNTGPSVLTGDLGVSPGLAITGFPPGTRTGMTHAGDAVALQAQNDVITQYNALASAACKADLTGQDLGGQTLTSGVYCFSSSAQLTGTLTLNAQGNANATFIFKTGSTLTTASGSSVLLINGGNPCGVAWQIGSSATLGTTTSFIGNLIALSSITLNTGANIIGGRALARNGAVTLDTNNISFASCGVSPPPVPTLTTWAVIALIGLLALAGFATLGRRQSPTGQRSF
jgi:MYXO-CTERM domain-containing protein